MNTNEYKIYKNTNKNFEPDLRFTRREILKPHQQLLQCYG